MARTKQRENYGNGSVSAVMVNKTDKEGNVVYGKDGKPQKVQKVDRRSGKPTWRICITLGTERYVDKSGKLRKRQRKVQKTYHGTLKEAREFARALGDDYANVDYNNARDSFSALCEEWGKKPYRCSEKQHAQYMRFLSYVSPLLDGKPLIEIQQADIEAAIESATKSHNYSTTTRNKMLAAVRRVFEYGIDADYIPKNPCRMIENVEVSSVHKRNALSEKQAAKLRIRLDEEEAKLYAQFEDKERRQAEHGNTFGRSSLRGLCALSNVLAVRLMLATGLRRGEALGLTWENVNTDKGTIRVCQTLNESCVIKEPKTNSGVRSLFVDEYTMEHLRKWKAFQKKALHLVNANGSALTQDTGTFVFCSEVGGFIDPTNFARWWNAFRSRIGFNCLLVHELRHTQVTLLLGNGVDWSMVQSRVGHARPSSVTLTYLHELPARDEKAAGVIGRILYETNVKAGNKGKVVARLPKTA